MIGWMARWSAERRLAVIRTLRLAERYRHGLEQSRRRRGAHGASAKIRDLVLHPSGRVDESLARLPDAHGVRGATRCLCGGTRRSRYTSFAINVVRGTRCSRYTLFAVEFVTGHVVSRHTVVVGTQCSRQDAMLAVHGFAASIGPGAHTPCIRVVFRCRSVPPQCAGILCGVAVNPHRRSGEWGAMPRADWKHDDVTVPGHSRHSRTPNPTHHPTGNAEGCYSPWTLIHRRRR